MNSPFGSPNSYGVIDIKAAKKKQNQIKTVTGSYVKLMNNWSQDMSQIDALLHNLRILISTQESVQRMESRHPQPLPLFEFMFTDAYSLLTGRLYSEIESIYHQLKHYIIGLGDVTVAMRMAEGEASSLVKNEKLDFFTVDGLDVIFTPDHVLTIQQLSCQYILEYERKQEIVRGVISCIATPTDTSTDTDDNNNTSNKDGDTRDTGDTGDASGIKDPGSADLPWLSSEELDRLISCWGDESDESYMDVEEVAMFLLMNGGQGISTGD